MSLLPPDHSQELLIFDIWERLRDFNEAVLELPDDLDRDFKTILPELIPLLDNYYYAESAVGAKVYDLWERYPTIEPHDMEIYTDALMCLLDSIASILYLLNTYNHEGICVYAFERMLGNSVVMRLKAMRPGDYLRF